MVPYDITSVRQFQANSGPTQVLYEVKGKKALISYYT